MKIEANQVKNEINYNYWVYVLTCLVVIGLPAYFVNRDSMTQILDVYSIVSQIVIMFIFSSLGWLVGKRFHLNYIWICCLGSLGYMLLKLLKGVFEFMVFSSDLSDLESLVFPIIVFIFGTFVVSGVIIIISYPIQYLFFQSKSDLV